MKTKPVFQIASSAYADSETGGLVSLHSLSQLYGEGVVGVQEVPCARQGHTAVWDFSDSLIVFGGLSESAVLNDVSVLSLSSGFWTRKECMGHAPSVRYAHSAVMIACNLMLVFGGCSAQVSPEKACKSLVLSAIGTQSAAAS